MDMVGTRILRIKSEVSDMTRHDTLAILKYPCHIIFVYAKYLSCFYTDGHAQILSLLPPFQGKTVLELGAGIGRFTSELAKEADQLIAVDFIDSVIKKVSIYISLQWLNFLGSITMTLGMFMGRAGPGSTQSCPSTDSIWALGRTWA